MCAHILHQSSIDCNAFLGGISKNYGTNYILSNSEYVVIEADEFDRSFHHLSPYMSVINGYDSNRRVKNVRFEGLKINGQTIYDDMPGKPRWYATTDYVPAFVGNHVEGVKFEK